MILIMIRLHNILKEPHRSLKDFYRGIHHIPHQLEPEVFLVHISAQAAGVSHECTLD